MGKLDATGTLAQTRGRQGGLVVSSNQSGSYVRAWFMPRRPKTPAQVAWANKWNNWAKSWTGLSDAERLDWEAESQTATWTRADWFGQTYQPSGLNLWMMIASIRTALGLALSDTPPSGVSPGAAIGCTMNLTPTDPVTGAHLCFLTVTQAAPATWAYAQIETSWLISADGAARNKPYRPFVAQSVGTNTLIDASARANEICGWLYPQTRCWFRWRGLTADLIPGLWQSGYGTTGIA